MGTCPHELCARYLQQDPDVSMASLTKWPHTQQPKSVSTADVQLRAKQQSAFSQPPAAAGSTLQTLMLRAQTRMQKQVDKDSTKRKGCGYPSRISQKEKEEEYYTAFGRFESPRSKLLQELAKRIGDGSWSDCFQALLTCTKKWCRFQKPSNMF